MYHTKFESYQFCIVSSYHICNKKSNIHPSLPYDALSAKYAFDKKYVYLILERSVKLAYKKSVTAY